MDTKNRAKIELETVRCWPCGQNSVLFERGDNVGETAARSGFHPIADISRGLEIKYVCPACWAKVKEGVAKLREVFGDSLRNIHMGSLLR